MERTKHIVRKKDMKESFMPFLADQLANSMEFFDDADEFANYIGGQTGLSYDVLKKIYNAYWKLNPMKVMFWDVPDWAGWLSSNFGIKESLMRKTTFKESKKDYVIYHNSYTSAVEEIHRFVEKNGFQINPEESATKIGLNSVRPKEGETTRIFLQLYQEDGVTPAGRALHAQVYGMDNRYELNMYISPLKKRDYMWYEGTKEDNLVKNKIVEIKKEIVLHNGNESVILESGDKIMVIKEAYEVAETIRQQIGHKAFYMMGAKNLLAHSDGLSFKIRGSKTYNGIKITLNGRDLYDVHFYKIHGAKITREKKFNDVYVDMLYSLIEEQTGLYLKL